MKVLSFQVSKREPERHTDRKRQKEKERDRKRQRDTERDKKNRKRQKETERDRKRQKKHQFGCFFVKMLYCMIPYQKHLTLSGPRGGGVSPLPP